MISHDFLRFHRIPSPLPCRGNLQFGCCCVVPVVPPAGSRPAGFRAGLRGGFAVRSLLSVRGGACCCCCFVGVPCALLLFSSVGVRFCLPRWCSSLASAVGRGRVCPVCLVVSPSPLRLWLGELYCLTQMGTPLQLETVTPMTKDALARRGAAAGLLEAH